MNFLAILAVFMRAFCMSPAALAAENLALRQQLAVYQRMVKRPKLRIRDRLFWIGLSQLWTNWRSALIVVQPDTVLKWHRQGFRLYWRWKSRHVKVGRPPVAREVRELIYRMSRENAAWGAPWIQAELHLLGLDVAQATVSKYMARPRKPSSPTWRTFLQNHLRETAAMDFVIVPTATFRLLYVFVVLRLDQRRIMHFNITAHPSGQWTGQQIVEAFPFDEAPRYLQRDRDGIYGELVQSRIRSLGIEEVVSAPRSPWQNPYVERLIGSIRRECLDHVIVLNEAHLKRILADYFAYYHEARPHQSLTRNAPIPREIEPPERGQVVAVPHLGGLHHRYLRRAA